MRSAAGLILLFILPPAVYPAELQGRLVSTEIRPQVIQAGSQFSLRLSAQNTGSAAWQTYGLKIRLYNSRRRLIKLPAGVEFGFSITAPWPAGLTGGADTPVTAPGLNEFFATGLVPGTYYYMAELYASPAACTAAELFRRSPLDKAPLHEIRIDNTSVTRRNAAVTSIALSTSAVSVKVFNYGAAPLIKLSLKAYAGGALLGEQALDLLPARQSLTADFPAPALSGGEKKLLLKAVLVAEDDYKEDNYLSAEVKVP